MVNGLIKLKCEWIIKFEMIKFEIIKFKWI